MNKVDRFKCIRNINTTDRISGETKEITIGRCRTISIGAAAKFETRLAVNPRYQPTGVSTARKNRVTRADRRERSARK